MGKGKHNGEKRQDKHRLECHLHSSSLADHGEGISSSEREAHRVLQLLLELALHNFSRHAIAPGALFVQKPSISVRNELHHALHVLVHVPKRRNHWGETARQKK